MFIKFLQNLHASLLEQLRILGYNVFEHGRKEVAMYNKVKKVLPSISDVDELIFQDEDAYVSEK